MKEIIVIDDGSTDGSLELLKQYGDSIQLIGFSKNRGAIEARNHGAALATGDYLVFLDGDDLFMPWTLDVYEQLVEERVPKVIFAPNFWFHGEIPPLRDEDIPRKIEFVDYKTFLSKDRPFGLSASTFVIERQAFRDVGAWSTGIFHLDCQDLCTKLGVSGRMILITSPPTAYYRIHTANSIHTVQPFLRMAHRLMDKEMAGEYPGGREHQFERRAWLGGLWVFWTKRAFRASLYKDGVKLAISGRSMIAAGVARRFGALIKGRRPLETIELKRN
jgi:glycosyltransferase involved in cell wall biosynthesis